MHIPFALVLTVLTLALSCVPAVLIWTMFSNLMDSTMDLLYSSTTNGTDELSSVVQDLLLRNSLQLLNSRIEAGDTEALSQEALLHSTGLVNLSLHPNVTNLGMQIINKMRPYNFDIIKGNLKFSYLSMVASVFDADSTFGKNAYWIVWQVLNIDIIKSMMGLPQPYGRTLYLCTVQLSKDEQWEEMEIWYVDQTTGMPLVQLASNTYPWQGFYDVKQVRAGWLSDLYINTYSGQVELAFVKNVISGNQQFEIGIALNTQTLSEELRSQLSNPKDRLFLFFRNVKGHLIATSHGKYFSLSDVDMRFINPLVNPPNYSAYQLYTCLNSNDALILEACKNLVARYHNWTLIPESHQEMLLNNSRYWVATGYSTSSLSATIVLLKDRQSVMGSIDASNTQVRKNTDDKRGTASLVFGVATAVAAVVPLLIGLWLGHRLLHLARGMDSITQLDFKRSSLPQAHFREIYNFQQSFVKMERGLRAFGKFVPSAVVSQLVAGSINTNDKMESASITVMFADIESFSTVAETIAPSQLAEVCTDYFEVMCKHVVNCDGTIDKFIGDCIMAMWNAPHPKPGHERSAVTACLLMQTDVLLLHEAWQQRNLPALKFRLGLHTGNCLVGNFGCSYRVSYTCLGDNVNLASRLEALNKKFGTTLCVSQSTYAGCRDDFHFRHLSRVTVPGRSEVLSVYEIICLAGVVEDVAEPATSPCSPNDVTVRLTKPTLEDDLRLEPVDSEVLEEPTGQNLTGASLCREMSENKLRDQSFATRDADDIPYHWGWHDRETVLRETAEYEAAYSALVEGRYTQCRGMVAAHPSDKAWKALAAQLVLQIGSNHPWDGVLRFQEK